MSDKQHKADKPDKPDKPNKPDKPDKPDKPNKPNKPNLLSVKAELDTIKTELDAVKTELNAVKTDLYTMVDQRKPDLIPLPPDESGGFCRTIRIGNDLMLLVIVRNQGMTSAPPSVTRVEFVGSPNPVDTNTPDIPPLSQVALLVPVPANAFNPDLRFTITVDHGNVVDEFKEDNNTAVGTCVG